MIVRRSLVLAALVGALVVDVSGCTATSSPTASSTASTRPTGAAAAAPGPIELPANPRVYFFGDSWTNGATAAPGRGFPIVLSRSLGWTTVLGPDNSGAGFVHTFNTNHALLPEAAAELAPVDADLIVLEGGLNDKPGPLTHFWDRVALTVKTLRSKAHGAPLVLVGPASTDGTVPEGLSAIDFEEAGVAKQLGIHYVSPLKESWFNPTNVDGLIDPTTVHPNTAGHAYYAGRLAADLQRFVTTRRGTATPEPTTTAP